ncbi:MAG: hypothetical protein ACRC0R_06530 [Cetobacterium sp.]
MILILESYDIKDYGSYRFVSVKYNVQGATNIYSVNGGEDISAIGDFVVPSTTVDIKLKGFKSVLGYSKSIEISMDIKKEVNIADFNNPTRMEIGKSERLAGDFDNGYFMDIYGEGQAELGIPRRVITNKISNPIQIIVSKSMENRLDYIAEKYMGNGRFWWVIADYNKILNPFILPVGTELEIPDLSDMHGRGGPMRDTEHWEYQTYTNRRS